LKNIFFYIDRT